MISLDVGFCFYETSLDTVVRAIESVKDHVSHIFAIDGKFEFFESSSELSTPEVRDYLSSVKNVILEDFPNRKENEKRQRYLDLAYGFQSDYLLILDGDEFITSDTDWEKVHAFLEEKYPASILPKIWAVEVKSNYDSNVKKKSTSMPRIWQRPYLIEYLKTHNFWKFSDGTIWKSQPNFPRVPGIYLKGNDKARDIDYIKAAFEYQTKLMTYEKPFKAEYRKVAKNMTQRHDDTTFYGIPMV